MRKKLLVAGLVLAMSTTFAVGCSTSDSDSSSKTESSDETDEDEDESEDDEDYESKEYSEAADSYEKDLDIVMSALELMDDYESITDGADLRDFATDVDVDGTETLEGESVAMDIVDIYDLLADYLDAQNEGDSDTASQLADDYEDYIEYLENDFDDLLEAAEEAGVDIDYYGTEFSDSFVEEEDIEYEDQGGEYSSADYYYSDVTTLYNLATTFSSFDGSAYDETYKADLYDCLTDVDNATLYTYEGTEVQTELSKLISLTISVIDAVNSQEATDLEALQANLESVSYDLDTKIEEFQTAAENAGVDTESLVELLEEYDEE